MDSLLKRVLLRAAIHGSVPAIAAVGLLVLAAVQTDTSGFFLGGLSTLMAIAAALTLALANSTSDFLGEPPTPGNHAKAALASAAIALVGMAVVLRLLCMGPHPAAVDDYTWFNFVMLALVLFAVPQGCVTFGRLRRLPRWETFLVVLFGSGTITVLLAQAENRASLVTFLAGFDAVFFAYLEGAAFAERWCEAKGWMPGAKKEA